MFLMHIFVYLMPNAQSIPLPNCLRCDMNTHAIHILRDFIWKIIEKWKVYIYGHPYEGKKNNCQLPQTFTSQIVLHTFYLYLIDVLKNDDLLNLSIGDFQNTTKNEFKF